jgi:IclR family mhp operon transcriptional activator
MTRFGSVRALARGLEVLQAINQRNGLKAAEIAKTTGIPRPTVYRLLETLEGLNMVARDHSTDKWRPTLHTRSLSSGFRDADWVCQIAVPEMTRLSRDILWPVDLVTFRDYEMEIRESTHSTSPYSIDHGMVGLRTPVLDTASGRCFLAFSSDEDRAHIMAGLRERIGICDPVILKDGPLDLVLAQSREMGLGFRKEGFRDATMSISAPIFAGGRVTACITIIWTSAALKFDKAVALFRGKLLAAAGTISAQMDQ